MGRASRAVQNLIPILCKSQIAEIVPIIPLSPIIRSLGRGTRKTQGQKWKCSKRRPNWKFRKVGQIPPPLPSLPPGAPQRETRSFSVIVRNCVTPNKRGIPGSRGAIDRRKNSDKKEGEGEEEEEGGAADFHFGRCLSNRPKLSVKPLGRDRNPKNSSRDRGGPQSRSPSKNTVGRVGALCWSKR